MKYLAAPSRGILNLDNKIRIFKGGKSPILFSEGEGTPVLCHAADMDRWDYGHYGH